MSAEPFVSLVLTSLALVVALLGLTVRRGSRLLPAVTLGLLTLALVVAWLHGPADSEDAGPRWLTLLAGALAVAGGGQVTTMVFSFIDGGERVRQAGQVLRGGAWIGALERVAVFATVMAGWGPGLAIVLAVKGLGRYPELRNDDDTGVAERFIIGTFTSVLWAAACAGLAVLAVRTP
jgi:hypothetical protein